MVLSQGNEIYPTKKIYPIGFVQEFPLREVITQLYEIYPIKVSKFTFSKTAKQGETAYMYQDL